MSLFARKLAVSNPVDTPHVISQVAETKPSLLTKFLAEYDPAGNLKFDDVLFRKGAAITQSFGLQDGFKIIDGKMVWGYVRLHVGVDRAGGGTETFDWGSVDDVVRVPFHAHRSAIHEYGNTSYGTLTVLFNDEYKFEFRIAHLNPDTKNRKGNEKGPLIPWAYERLKKRQSFERNWVLGSAGSWGDSTGAHTHTEIKSYDTKCEVLEAILTEKFGVHAYRDYDAEEVLVAYRKQRNYKTATSDTILRDYAQLREDKKTILLNPYKCEYVDFDGKVRTRYSTEALFNGL